MTRDRRLMIALVLFFVALIAGVIQAWIIRLYLTAAVMRGEYQDHFTDLFGLKPVVGPNQVCFDYCAPSLPFVAGWIGITAFISGVMVLAFAWWRPKQ